MSGPSSVSEEKLSDKAMAYMKRAGRRFRKKHACNSTNCEFCAGWTWGAVDGYLAGAKSVQKGKSR